MKNYLRANEHIVPIDPLENCSNWTTRIQFHANLNSCLNVKINSTFVRVPYQINLRPGEDFDRSKIMYPVIIKADIASVQQISHIMSVVFNPSGISKAIELYNEDFIIQEFINHDMTVYKVYVIGDQISYKPRESCSNISSNGADFITFNLSLIHI